MTLADYGSQIISVCGVTTSVWCTVLLGVTMDGTKLRPFIIFKGREGRRVIREFFGDNFPHDSVCTVQDKAWIDRRDFLEYVEKVWKPYCANKPFTYLLMDDFPVHLMTESVHAIQDCGTENDFLLDGYTKDGVNEPYKDYMKRCYEHYRVENDSSTRVKRMHISK